MGSHQSVDLLEEAAEVKAVAPAARGLTTPARIVTTRAFVPLTMLPPCQSMGSVASRQ